MILQTEEHKNIFPGHENIFVTKRLLETTNTNYGKRNSTTILRPAAEAL